MAPSHISRGNLRESVRQSMDDDNDEDDVDEDDVDDEGHCKVATATPPSLSCPPGCPRGVA